MTFTTKEMLVTKLRVLLKREKGRNLFDLAHALEVFKDLNRTRLLECFNLYLESANVKPLWAVEQRMLAKRRRSRFFYDMKPLLLVAALHHFGDDSTQ